MRAYIRPIVTRATLKNYGVIDQDTIRWLLESKDSFHGIFKTDWDGSKEFIFEDQRIIGLRAFPAEWVQCEEHSMVPNTTMNFMYCENCGEGLDEGLKNMPKEPIGLYD